MKEHAQASQGHRRREAGERFGTIQICEESERYTRMQVFVF